MDSVGGEDTTMSAMPIDNLELRAMEQRSHLHQRAAELRTKIEETRENLSLDNQSRQHFVPLAVAVSVVGLLFGYSFMGMFTAR